MSQACSTDPLLVERPEPAVLRLLLNRPDRKNALTREMVLALGDELEKAGADRSVRAILLTGSGGSFCAGADLTSISGTDKNEIGERIDEFHRMITGIVDAPQPVVAAVDGPAVGFGADLALACDMRVFGENAYLEEGFVKVGLMPDGGGTHWMPRFVGPRAFEFLALARRLDAKSCAEFGIANQVTSSDQLEVTAAQICSRLIEMAPLALQRIKWSLKEGQRDGLFATLKREREGQSALIGSSDFEEGVRAFLEKRAPKFQGK